MRLIRPFISVVLIAAVLALSATAAAQDEPTPELISEEPTTEAPPRSDEAAYTQWFVRQAIERYDAEGRDAALEYFNNPAGVDGQWYVFVVNSDGILIGHPTRPDLRGTSTAARLDVFGKPYGQEIVAATADGRWVDYYFDH
ncbi:MAG: cache domain-containing protein, partial [Acidimicrobiia bacterium]|nr:cache domain-containing protein [Acidimicrobiia bacterium]